MAHPYQQHDHPPYEETEETDDSPVRTSESILPPDVQQRVDNLNALASLNANAASLQLNQGMNPPALSFTDQAALNAAVAASISPLHPYYPAATSIHIYQPDGSIVAAPYTLGGASVYVTPPDPYAADVAAIQAAIQLATTAPASSDPALAARTEPQLATSTTELVNDESTAAAARDDEAAPPEPLPAAATRTVTRGVPTAQRRAFVPVTEEEISRVAYLFCEARNGSVDLSPFDAIVLDHRNCGRVAVEVQKRMTSVDFSGGTSNLPRTTTEDAEQALGVGEEASGTDHSSDAMKRVGAENKKLSQEVKAYRKQIVRLQKDLTNERNRPSYELVQLRRTVRELEKALASQRKTHLEQAEKDRGANERALRAYMRASVHALKSIKQRYPET